MRATPVSPTVRRIVAAAFAVLAAAVLLAGPAAAKSHKHPPSHMVISHVVLGSEYAFKRDSSSAIAVCARITNIGRGPSSSGAELIMSLLGPDGSNEIVARHDLPTISGTPPAKRGHKPHHPTFHGCASQNDASLGLPVGAYGVQVCVEDSRSQGRDGCHFCHGKCFFIAKRTWTGTADGTQVSSAQNESWQAGAVTFTFTGYAPPGKFAYGLNAAQVNYQITATRGFCTESGGGTLTANSGELKIDHVGNTYEVQGDVPSDGTIPAVVTCPGVSSSEMSGVQSTFLDDGFTPNPLPAFGGEERLTRGYSYSTSIGSLQYHWDLK
jgi:hypothetical protein